MLQAQLIFLAGLLLPLRLVTAQLAKPAMRSDGWNSWQAGLKENLHGPSWKAVEWPAGTISESCKKQAVGASVDPTKMTTYEVTYDDCATPWLLCRHADSELSVLRMIDRFGRTPTHMRQFVASPIWVPDPRGANGYAVGADITFKGDSEALWIYLHEATHAMESADAFNASALLTDRQPWLDAYNKDTAVPDEYSRTNQRENLAQHSGIVIYDRIVPGGAAGHDPNVSKIANQQAELKNQGATGKYGGNHFLIRTSCTARFANSKPVPASGSSRFKKRQSLGDLIKLVNWETIDQQRQKLQNAGAILLDDVVKTQRFIEQTVCKF